MSSFSKEFKEALSHLPIKEKDKLILRLLKKDLNLANRLIFELIDTRTVEERRSIVEEELISSIETMTKRFSAIGALTMNIRYLSGVITEHVRITKDKYGEVSLNILLLIEVLRQNKENIITASPPVKLHKFAVAIIARVFKVLLLINKMDEDLFLDFKADLAILGNLIGDNRVIINTAIRNGLDVNWLIYSGIPTDIIEIYKDLKNHGYLR